MKKYTLLDKARDRIILGFVQGKYTKKEFEKLMSWIDAVSFKKPIKIE